jgi:hypothetical protein
MMTKVAFSTHVLPNAGRNLDFLPMTFCVRPQNPNFVTINLHTLEQNANAKKSTLLHLERMGFVWK